MFILSLWPASNHMAVVWINNSCTICYQLKQKSCLMTGGKRKENKKERGCRESNPRPLTWATSVVNTKLQPPALTILHTWHRLPLSHTWQPLTMCRQNLVVGVNCKSFSVRREPMAWAASVVISSHWSFLIPFSRFINWLMRFQVPHFNKEISYGNVRLPSILEADFTFITCAKILASFPGSPCELGKAWVWAYQDSSTVNSKPALIGNSQTQQIDARWVAHVPPPHSKHTTFSSNAIKTQRTCVHMKLPG